MAMPTFFTALPKDEQVTGSRDPLGFLPLWSELGRQSIANVTTVSSDMPGWVTLALGTMETRELVGDDDDAFLGTFLMVEQAVAYARCVDKNERTVRGSNEVRKRLKRGNHQVLGADKRSQILVGQRTTGVWGQVSRPARRSGLLDEGDDRLTDRCQETVEALVDEALGKSLRQRLRRCVRAKKFALNEEDELIRALQALHAPRPSGLRQQLLRERVLFAGGSEPEPGAPLHGDETLAGTLHRQHSLVRLLQRTPRDWSHKPFTTLATLQDRARSEGDLDLAAWLEKVQLLEQLLGPLERLFRFLLIPSSKSISELAHIVGESFASLPLRAAEGFEVAQSLASKGAGFEQLEAAQRAFVTQDWPSLVVAVVERNKAIMNTRQRAAWVVRTPDDRLQVDLGAPDDGAIATLPHDLETCWTHGFYLPELHRLVDDIEGIEVAHV